MAVEQEISQVAPLHNIGSLALETQPLKYSLKSEAASWKAQYAKNLHKQGSEDLKGFDQYMRDTTLKLNRKVEDLEDVRFIMGVLKEVSSVGLSSKSVKSAHLMLRDMLVLIANYTRLQHLPRATPALTASIAFCDGNQRVNIIELSLHQRHSRCCRSVKRRRMLTT